MAVRIHFSCLAKLKGFIVAYLGDRQWPAMMTSWNTNQLHYPSLVAVSIVVEGVALICIKVACLASFCTTALTTDR